MQPQQYTPQPTPPPQNNYDFILNPQQPQRRSFGGGSMQSRMLVVAGGALLLIIIAFIAMKLLSGGGAFDKNAMLSVAQDQTEIIRLASTGNENSVSSENKNFSMTARLTVQSDRAALLTYLGEAGFKVKDKTLVLKQSAATDEILSNAKSSSTFDTAYKDVMKKTLEAYRANLTSAYQSTSSQTGKKTLTSSYESANLLLTQLTGEVQE